MSLGSTYLALCRKAPAPVIEVRDTYPGPTPKWQVIFHTHSGLDYCRESLDGELQIEFIKAWATLSCYEHDLAGARIERW